MTHNASGEGINLLARCPSCQAVYRSDAGRVVAQQEGETIMHLSCEVCRHALLIAVRAKQGGISCTGVITDLAYEDALTFWNSAKISVDDVIQAHTALKLDKFLKKG